MCVSFPTVSLPESKWTGKMHKLEIINHKQRNTGFWGKTHTHNWMLVRIHFVYWVYHKCHVFVIILHKRNIKSFFFLTRCKQSPDGRLEVKGQHGSSSLQIKDVKLSDSGRYDCEAASRIGGHQKSMYLDIECKSFSFCMLTKELPLLWKIHIFTGRSKCLCSLSLSS